MSTLRFWFWSARRQDLGLLDRFIWLSGLIRPSRTSSSCQWFGLLKGPLLSRLHWTALGADWNRDIRSHRQSNVVFEKHHLNVVSMEGSPILPKDFFVVKGVGSALSGLCRGRKVERSSQKAVHRDIPGTQWSHSFPVIVDASL